MKKIILIITNLLFFFSANASENGGSVYANGSENFMVGDLPPPGLYALIYGNSYHSERVNDKDGNNKNIPGFKTDATVLVPRLAWITNTKINGGDLVAHMVLPIVDIKVSNGSTTQTKAGVGDITIGSGVAFHNGAWNWVYAFDAYLPTGNYNKNDIANTGRNYVALEPLYAVSYVNRVGLNADMRAGYLFNRKNNQTEYTSGQELHIDYSAGWGLGNGWTVGLGGYIRQQTTDDKKDGVSVVDSKVSGMAIGPSIKFDSGRGWLITAKWQKEQKIKNAAEGEALWIKAVFPL